MSMEPLVLSTLQKSKITTLLFDLDGTLVSMDRRFELPLMLRGIKRFWRLIPPWKFPRAFWSAVKAIKNNESGQTNYEVFLKSLCDSAKCSRGELEKIFKVILEVDFIKSGKYFKSVEGAREVLNMAKELGLRCILATNPMFPLEAVKFRLTCGGFGHEEFEFITHSQNMKSCKPKVRYYEDLLARLDLAPDSCLMIGNDAYKDLPASLIGVCVFLLENENLEKSLKRAPRVPHLRGTFEDLKNILQTLGARSEGKC